MPALIRIFLWVIAIDWFRGWGGSRDRERDRDDW